MNSLSRRRFLSLGGTTLGLLSLQPASVLASMSLQDDSNYTFQLSLLQKIKTYAEQELLMELNRDFYTKWKAEDGMYHILYVSKSNSVEAPKSFRFHRSFGTNESRALAQKDRYDRAGFHTMLYKTSGTADVELTTNLLSYTPESIAVIGLHEAMHVHLRHVGRIPYELEEAAAEIVGNYGALEFSKKAKAVKGRKAKKQIQLNEEIYSCLNRHTQLIMNTTPTQFGGVYNSCEAEMKALLRKADKFKQQRFTYPINNAYFLRYTYYCKHYFLLKQLLEEIGDLKAFIAFMFQLPKDLPIALQEINTRIGKINTNKEDV